MPDIGDAPAVKIGHQRRQRHARRNPDRRPQHHGRHGLAALPRCRNRDCRRLRCGREHPRANGKKRPHHEQEQKARQEAHQQRRHPERELATGHYRAPVHPPSSDESSGVPNP